MVEAKHKKIDGKEITVTQFPAFEGLRIKTRLIKVFGSAVGALVGGVKGNTPLLDSQIDMEKAISALMQNIDEDGTPELIERLLASTRINNREITRDVFNMEFAGNYLFLYKILAFVLETNHFFDFMFTGTIKEKLTMMGSQTPSSDTSMKQ